MWFDAIINIIFNILIKIKNLIIKNWFTFILIMFIYNFLLIYLEVLIYHITAGAYIVTNTLGWWSWQIYFLLLLLFFPDVLLWIKKIFLKLS